MAFVNITPTTTFKASLFYFAILEMVKPSPALIPFILHYSFVPNCRGGGGGQMAKFWVYLIITRE